MTCSYCEQEITTQPIKEHFFPKSNGGKTKNNLIWSCRHCNTIKHKFIFWSVESVKEYLMLKRNWTPKSGVSQSSTSYQNWLMGKIFSVPKERLFLLALAFGDKSLSASLHITINSKNDDLLRDGNKCLRRKK